MPRRPEFLALPERERVAAAVHDLSVRLAACEDGSLDEEVLYTLGRLAALADVDRVYLIRFSPDGQFFTTTHEWCTPGTASHADYIARVAVGKFPHSTKVLGNGEAYIVSDVDALGDEDEAERESFSRYGVRAVLQMPMNVGGRLVGLVGLNDLRRTRQWDRDAVDLLVGVCDVLGHTLTRSEALAEARVARADAERLRDESQRLLARVSHEMRTPLHAILGFGELLAGELPAQAALIGHIRDASARLQQMVDAVLDITTLDLARPSTRVGPVDIGPVVRSVRDLMSTEAIERGVRLHVDESCAQFAVHADADHLLQLVQVFVSNGVRHNRVGGSCSISAHAVAGARIAIVVNDDGPGIPPEDLERAFEPFERLGAEFGGVPGFGLGLTFARQLAAALNASIDVTSTVGTGTTATVVLRSGGRLR